jgi:hypothetical protein
MAAHKRIAVGYNVRVAVDVKHKLIVEQQVTNQVVDMGLLTQSAEPAKEALGIETLDVVAACEKAGIAPYVARPQPDPSVQAGCSARLSSNMTQPRTAMFGRQLRVKHGNPRLPGKVSLPDSGQRALTHRLG